MTKHPTISKRVVWFKQTNEYNYHLTSGCTIYLFIRWKPNFICKTGTNTSPAILSTFESRNRISYNILGPSKDRSSGHPISIAFVLHEGGYVGRRTVGTKHEGLGGVHGCYFPQLPFQVFRIRECNVCKRKQQNNECIGLEHELETII